MRLGDSRKRSIAVISSKTRCAGNTAENRPPLFSRRFAVRQISSSVIDTSCREIRLFSDCESSAAPALKYDGLHTTASYRPFPSFSGASRISIGCTRTRVSSPFMRTLRAAISAISG